MKRLRDYDSMERDGLSPFAAYARHRQAGRQRLESLAAVRRDFDLSLAEAKEVMIIAEGSADSLWDHQEKLAELIEDELADLGALDD